MLMLKVVAVCVTVSRLKNKCQLLKKMKENIENIDNVQVFNFDNRYTFFINNAYNPEIVNACMAFS